MSRAKLRRRVFVADLATEFGAVKCCWRESDRAFTGFVAEVWFSESRSTSEFAVKWTGVVGYPIKVRCVESSPARFAASVPVEVPAGEVRLGWVSRGGRVRCELVS
jgi:hypothetical protein